MDHKPLWDIITKMALFAGENRTDHNTGIFVAYSCQAAVRYGPILYNKDATNWFALQKFFQNWNVRQLVTSFPE